MASVELRQQLSCDSKELLERAGHAELQRLRDLRGSIIQLRAGTDVLDRMDKEIALMQVALQQLAYVYVDQFEAGRIENDRAGRFGLAK